MNKGNKVLAVALRQLSYYKQRTDFYMHPSEEFWHILQNSVSNLCFTCSVPKKEQSYNRSVFKLNSAFLNLRFLRRWFSRLQYSGIHDLIFGKRGLLDSNTLQGHEFILRLLPQYSSECPLLLVCLYLCTYLPLLQLYILFLCYQFSLRL